MIRHILFCFVVFTVFDAVFGTPFLVGGPSEIKDATPEIIALAAKIRSKYEKDSARKIVEFTPIKYRTQTVAGTNYFIKVRVAPKQYIHIRVHKPLIGDELLLHGVLHNKKENDPLEYFDGNRD